MIRKSILLFFYGSVFVVLSCDRPIERKSLSSENPTTHIFNVSKDLLKERILASFNEHRYLDSKLYESSVLCFQTGDSDNDRIPVGFIAETSKDAVFGKGYFYGFKTSDDIYLYTSDYWLSPIYHSGDTPLEFTSNYVVKLTPIDSFHTKVSVFADKPEVINGSEWGGMHGRKAKTFPAKGTSIEEYTLILFIAEQLGIKNLTPVDRASR